MSEQQPRRRLWGSLNCEFGPSPQSPALHPSPPPPVFIHPPPRSDSDYPGAIRQHNGGGASVALNCVCMECARSLEAEGRRLCGATVGTQRPRCCQPCHRRLKRPRRALGLHPPSLLPACAPHLRPHPVCVTKTRTGSSPEAGVCARADPGADPFHLAHQAAVQVPHGHPEAGPDQAGPTRASGPVPRGPTDRTPHADTVNIVYSQARHRDVKAEQ